MMAAPRRLEERTVAVSVSDASEWSVILDDRNPLHSDPASGARTGVGHGIVNPGPANMAHLITLLHDSFPGARLESFEARFVAAVFAPGTAVVRGVVDHEEATEEGLQLHCSLELIAAGMVALKALARIRLPAQ